MSVTDAINLALAVVTALGVIIALLTFRRSLAGRARLDMSLGPEILLHFTCVPELVLTADFSIINKGAQPGIVTEISAVIYDTAPDSQASQPLAGDRTYKAMFAVWATAASKKTFHYQYRLFIGPDDPANLAEHCTERNGTWSHRLVLR